jgi:hypothetical protein
VLKKVVVASTALNAAPEKGLLSEMHSCLEQEVFLS